MRWLVLSVLLGAVCLTLFLLRSRGGAVGSSAAAGLPPEACTATTPTEGGGVEVRYRDMVKLPSGDVVESGYVVYLPADYTHDEGDWPLLLFLHGSGQSGRNLDRLVAKGLPRRAREEPLPFVLLVPQCPREDDWTFDGQLQRLGGLTERVAARYRIDPDRIYLTGYSMGGYAVWDLALANPHRFAALMPICGRGYPRRAKEVKHLPAWVFHGALDQAISVRASRKMVKALRMCDAPVIYTEYADGAHAVWDRAYGEPDLFQWLLQQRRGALTGETP